MAVSKAQQQATNKYIAKSYDRVNLTIPKGYKEEIKGYAESCQQSVNSFITEAIAEKIARCNDGAASVAAGIISTNTLEMAERAARRTGESVREFIARAVDTQEDLDLTTLDHGYNPVTGRKRQEEA